MDEEFLAWLKSMGPKPPNKKEIERMGNAITFDLKQCQMRGISVESRIKCLSYLNYMYEGIIFSLP